MIQTGKKLWLKTVNIFLEDDKIESAIKSGRYDYINIISYNKLSLPGFQLRQKETAFLDLALPEEEIFRKFNDTTRNEIRQTQRLDDFKVVIDGDDFSGIYQLYNKFEYAQGRVPFPAGDLKSCHTFSASYRGEIIAGIFVDEAGKHLRLRYIFSKRVIDAQNEIYKLTSKATRRLVWEICQWGKSKGFDLLDLATINFNNPKTVSIAKFKMSFGGQIVPEYTYIYRSPLFKIFEKLASFRASLSVFIKKYVSN